MWTKSYSVDVKRCAYAGLLSIWIKNKLMRGARTLNI